RVPRAVLRKHHRLAAPVSRMPGRVFVTGGSGLVGAALLRRLARDGRETVALARSERSSAVVAGLGARPARGDVLDPDGLADSMRGCDVVFHVAGAIQTCATDASLMVRTNVEGTRNVVEAAARAGVRAWGPPRPGGRRREPGFGAGARSGLRRRPPAPDAPARAPPRPGERPPVPRRRGGLRARTPPGRDPRGSRRAVPALRGVAHRPRGPRDRRAHDRRSTARVVRAGRCGGRAGGPHRGGVPGGRAPSPVLPGARAGARARAIVRRL